MDGYHACIRRASNNIMPGFVQLIETLSGKNFMQLIKNGDIRDVVSKIYSTDVADIIINILIKRLEEVCGRHC
ncbi:MAG: hypothetical protein N3E36_07335 [Sulfolobales archaeon]|nr:hypothetical protein [Ignisphaera sp.]MCX8199804.1 hypothetical protein [Sulfolobales archaeon]MDW8084956.1 hypothetical protein [Ignisphaera sp.]